MVSDPGNLENKVIEILKQRKRAKGLSLFYRCVLTCEEKITSDEMKEVLARLVGGGILKVFYAKNAFNPPAMSQTYYELVR